MASIPNNTPKGLLALAALLVLISTVSLGAAGSEKWTTKSGESFRGEATDIIGPMALFRISPTAGRRVLLSEFSEADCVRIHKQLVARNASRADDWSKATSKISRELFGSVQEIVDSRLVDVDLTGRPEPEFYVVFYATDSIRFAHDMINLSRDKAVDVRSKFPGQVEAVFFGIRHNETEHRRMAMELKIPYLVTDILDQTKMEELRRFAPPTGEWQMVVLHRDGIPIFSAVRPLEKEIETIFEQLNGMLELTRPHTAAGWQDRLHYYKAVQPVAYASGHCDPLFIADPLNAAQLRTAGVPTFSARLQIAADGHVAKVGIMPGAPMEMEMKQAVAGALLKAVFVPAVTDGKFVDGEYAYSFKNESK